MTKQNTALLATLGGAVVFLGSFGQLLLQHSNWNTFLTPEVIGHVCLILASAITTVIGALRFQMPRNGDDYNDRVSDSKLKDINTQGSDR